MSSLRISITPSRRAAARFISRTRRALQKALLEEERKSGLTQSDIARKIDVHRSVISRELRGTKDISLGRIGELAWAMGRVPQLDFVEPQAVTGSNIGLGFEDSSLRTHTSSSEGTFAPATDEMLKTSLRAL